jgi:hypothetical protein
MNKLCDLNLKYVHDKGVFLKKNQTTIVPRDMIFICLSNKGWPEQCSLTFFEIYICSTRYCIPWYQYHTLYHHFTQST